jgi:hypothetical protein
MLAMKWLDHGVGMVETEARRGGDSEGNLKLKGVKC